MPKNIAMTPAVASLITICRLTAAMQEDSITMTHGARIASLLHEHGAELADALESAGRVAELWECDSCGFGFDAGDTNTDGLYSCPVCRLGELERTLSASTGREESKQIIISQLERRIERARALCERPGGLTEMRQLYAILRGDADA